MQLVIGRLGEAGGIKYTQTQSSMKLDETQNVVSMKKNKKRLKPRKELNTILLFFKTASCLSHLEKFVLLWVR